jgi:hypothetical protein
MLNLILIGLTLVHWWPEPSHAKPECSADKQLPERQASEYG